MEIESVLSLQGVVYLETKEKVTLIGCKTLPAVTNVISYMGHGRGYTFLDLSLNEAKTLYVVKHIIDANQ